MVEPHIGMVLRIKIHLPATEQGGGGAPIQDGYRPLCKIGHDNDESVIGLCELQVTGPIGPGESGSGRLAFSTAVA
jgi:hypothetical protein